jgi:hypothetical protein
MDILDDTGSFSPQHLTELSEFVEKHLLSTSKDRDWVSSIIIVEERSNYAGRWLCEETKNSLGEITSIDCLIFLNVFHVRRLSLALEIQIKELKKILSHEYGHHWTLSYLIRNHGFNFSRDRLPQEYYEARGLNTLNCIEFYTKQSHKHDWYRCDKEIIAEDYRCLFAPPPYNVDHQIVEAKAAKHVITLDHPNSTVRKFIENIHITYGLKKK